jgi:hypothetical protein
MHQRPTYNPVHITMGNLNKRTRSDNHILNRSVSRLSSQKNENHRFSRSLFEKSRRECCKICIRNYTAWRIIESTCKALSYVWQELGLHTATDIKWSVESRVKSVYHTSDPSVNTQATQTSHQKPRNPVGRCPCRQISRRRMSPSVSLSPLELSCFRVEPRRLNLRKNSQERYMRKTIQLVVQPVVQLYYISRTCSHIIISNEKKTETNKRRETLHQYKLEWLPILLF